MIFCTISYITNLINLISTRKQPPQPSNPKYPFPYIIKVKVYAYKLGNLSLTPPFGWLPYYQRDQLYFVRYSREETQRVVCGCFKSSKIFIYFEAKHLFCYIHSFIHKFTYLMQ